MFSAADGWQEILCSRRARVPRGRGAPPRRTLRRRDVDLEPRAPIRFLEKGGKLDREADPRRASRDHPGRRRAARVDEPRRLPDPEPAAGTATGSGQRKVIYDTVKKIAERAGVTTHVHALRAAFAVRMDEQYPGASRRASKSCSGHSRVETTMVYLRRQDKAPRDGDRAGPVVGLRVSAQSWICPQRDSNPRYHLERVATWAASRWGRRERGYPRPELPSVAARAVSSAGRAPALHAGGRRFESCTAHKEKGRKSGPFVFGSDAEKRRNALLVN